MLPQWRQQYWWVDGKHSIYQLEADGQTYVLQRHLYSSSTLFRLLRMTRAESGLYSLESERSFEGEQDWSVGCEWVEERLSPVAIVALRMGQ